MPTMAPTSFSSSVFSMTKTFKVEGHPWQRILQHFHREIFKASFQLLSKDYERILQNYHQRIAKGSLKWGQVGFPGGEARLMMARLKPLHLIFDLWARVVQPTMPHSAFEDVPSASMVPALGLALHCTGLHRGEADLSRSGPTNPYPPHIHLHIPPPPSFPPQFLLPRCEMLSRSITLQGFSTSPESLPAFSVDLSSIPAIQDLPFFGFGKLV